MSAPDDPNRTVDVPSAAADSLDAGLAAGFAPPRSSLRDLPPVLLKEAEGESAHVVRPNSDAMPEKGEAGDRYQLFGEIARGGMGAVLRGRDVDLGRDLAIKVLLEKHADRPEVARRFLEEAQIGGQLQHPGVVPVYDIGRFGERPFFTMKLVKGQTLAALLAERTDPSVDRPRLLAIALQVAQALAYAHAKGVIHRDLKPANIMVGAFGEVQVMDWGLAKVLAEGGIADEEKSARQHQEEGESQIRTARSSGSAGSFGTETEAGSLLGTPAYMPPEQANGDVALVDRRCDVFGLGAILCEILTGKPPYVGRSSEEVRRKAANGDLAEALARLAGCGADQELLVLTRACLSPEADDRPRDAQAVAEALTAYLDGVEGRLRQAELAGAEARARAAEEAKRRRLTLALAGTVLLTLTLGGGGWLYIKNERDARQAQLGREVHEALNRATALREQARAIPAGGAALLAQAREQTQRALALTETGLADTNLLNQARRLQTELDEEERDRALVVALEGAVLAQADSSARENRFAWERAVPLFRAALRAYGLPAGEGDSAAAAEHIRRRSAVVREAVAAALDHWLELADNPRLNIAEPHRDWLRAVLEAAEPNDGWTRRFRAARQETNEPRRRAALEALAAEADARQLPARALTRLAAYLRPAQRLALLLRAQQHHPADFWVNHNLGLALQEVMPAKRDEAVRYLTAAVALRPDSPGAYNNLGTCLERNGQVDEAIPCFQKAIALDPKYAVAPFNLGNALLAKGQADRAIASYRKAIALDATFVHAHLNLGIVLEHQGQVDEAISCYQKALQIDPTYARAHAALGSVLQRKGQLDRAIASYRKAIALDARLGLVHNNLGQALQDKGKVDEASASFQKAIALDPKNALAHYNLGNVLYRQGQVDAAITCWRQAIVLDPKDAMAHTNLGAALLDRGKVDEAIACCQKAIALDSRIFQAHYHLGRALQRLERLDEAMSSYQKALALNPKFAVAHSGLAGARRLAAVRGKLPAFHRGEYHPASNVERLALAELCRYRKLYRTAACLYAEAFAANPRLAEDLQSDDRYHAACCAALATVGLDERERTVLRRRALTWLRAELTVYAWLAADDAPTSRALVQQRLRRWQNDAELASLRDRDALMRLPAEERRACERLWAEVAAILKKAEEYRQAREPGKLGSP